MNSTRKTVIVTGASQGIGAGIVRAFVERGFNVVANSRKVTQSTEVAASDRVALVDGHVGEPAAAARVVETALSRFQSIAPPGDAIKAKALLLVGLGDEDALSLRVLERVGRTALREAVRLGVSRVAYAPLIRDQGNSKFGTGDVADAVLRGVLLAYDTEKRLQKEGLAREFTLEQWNVEAGAAFFDDTVAGVQKGIDEATAAAAKRPSGPYATGAKQER
jgi:NAD(P)-dependent dehydrogenase (short-subunit alcohol dehydrogenase family)